MNLQNKWMRLGIAFSTANLLLLATWSELLFTEDKFHYYMYTAPTRIDYVAAIVNVFVLGLLLYILMQLISTVKSRYLTEVTRFAFLGLLLIPLNTVRLNASKVQLGIGTIVARSNEGFLILMSILLVAILCLVFYFRKALVFILAFLVLGFLPFAFITIGQAAYKAAQTPHDSTLSNEWSRPVAASNKRNTRVVWLIFDELDQGMLFTNRPSGLQLPSFDRLKSQSLMITRAVSPSTSTQLSIPSILTGTRILKTAIHGVSDLTVRTADQAGSVSIKQLPNVFRSVKRAGFPTAVIGWYHPYCRLFADSLDRCSWQPIYQTHIGQRPAEEKNLFNSMLDQIRAVSPFNGRRIAADGFREILHDAKEAVTKGSGLIYVHFPVPHAPVIYDRENKKFTSTGFSHIRGYVDNLALVDDTLAQIRSAMEIAGTWDDSVLIVSSDHPWRQANDFRAGRKQPYVPFLIKVPGEDTPLVVQETFETIHTHSLVVSIFKNEVYNYDTFLSKMKSHQSVSPDKQ